MSHNINDDKRDLLGQLATLEKKVEVLSSELQSRSETIELLERSLNEKRLHISELEAALRIARQSMLDLAWDNIQHYRQQISMGIDRNLSDPKFERLRQLLDLIRSFPAPLRQDNDISIIKTGRHLVWVARRHFHALRDDSGLYYQNTLSIIVSKYRMGLKQLHAFFARFIDEAQNFLDQKVLWPVKNVCDDVNEALKTAPVEVKFYLQNKLGRSLWQGLGRLSVSCSKLQIAIQSVLGRSVQPLWRQGYKRFVDKIKSVRDSYSFGSSVHDNGIYA